MCAVVGDFDGESSIFSQIDLLKVPMHCGVNFAGDYYSIVSGKFRALDIEFVHCDSLLVLVSSIVYAVLA